METILINIERIRFEYINHHESYKGITYMNFHSLEKISESQLRILVQVFIMQ